MLLGRQMKELIDIVCRSFIFYKDVESLEQPHIDTLQQYDDNIDLTYASSSHHI